VRARRFKDSDFDSVIGWLDKRQTPRFKRSFLPKRGWIVDDVGVIFLLKSDCKIGVLDFFVTNPEIDQEIRLQACDLLIQEAEKEAKKIGFEMVVGHTKILKVQALGIRYGFVYDPTPYYFFRKNLGDQKDERRNLSGIDGGQCVNADPAVAD
jgi:hypothetical protein